MREIIGVMRENVRKDAEHETHAKCVRIDRFALNVKDIYTFQLKRLLEDHPGLQGR